VGIEAGPDTEAVAGTVAVVDTGAEPDTVVVADIVAAADTAVEPDTAAVADIAVVADMEAEPDIALGPAVETEAGADTDLGPVVAEAGPDTDLGPAVAGTEFAEAEPDIEPVLAFAGGVQPGEAVPKDTHLRLSVDREKGWEEPLLEGAQVPAHIWAIGSAVQRRERLVQYFEASAGKEGLALSQ
jgi:hypothetical protein